jgi:hypothetical protein
MGKIDALTSPVMHHWMPSTIPTLSLQFSTIPMLPLQYIFDIFSNFRLCGEESAGHIICKHKPSPVWFLRCCSSYSIQYKHSLLSSRTGNSKIVHICNHNYKICHWNISETVVKRVVKWLSECRKDYLRESRFKENFRGSVPSERSPDHALDLVWTLGELSPFAPENWKRAFLVIWLVPVVAMVIVYFLNGGQNKIEMCVFM